MRTRLTVKALRNDRMATSQQFNNQREILTLDKFVKATIDDDTSIAMDLMNSRLIRKADKKAHIINEFIKIVAHRKQLILS